MWYWQDHMYNWGYGGWIMMILGLVVLGLIIWGVVSFARTGTVGVGGGMVTRREPMDIARERYARGEITKDQFEDIKKNLMS